jgi:hypothetical protein
VTQTFNINFLSLTGVLVHSEGCLFFVVFFFFFFFFFPLCSFCFLKVFFQLLFGVSTGSAPWLSSLIQKSAWKEEKKKKKKKERGK